MRTELAACRSALAVVIAAALGACGGTESTPPPPPAPAVTTVEVTPATPSVAAGDSVQLAVVVKDQNGNVLSGKATTWGSSADAVATVSTAGLVKGVAEGTATITATVESKHGTATVTVTKPAPLTLDPTKAANDSLGPAGGTITATATNGVVYRLTIPARALEKPVRITMTPIKAMGQLPLSGGFFGGVDLAPAGLRLAVPAELRITAPTTAPAGTRFIGFSYVGQADSLAPAVFADSGSFATVLVRHFSGAAGGFGTPLDITTFLTTSQSNNTSSQFYVNALLTLAAQSPRDISAELQVMRDWMTNVIIPGIQNAQNDFGLVLAVSEYNFWTEMPLAFGFTGASAALAPERAQAGAAAAPQLRNAIAGNNAACAANKDLESAANALFWQTQATLFGVDTPAEQLDRRTVLANLCIQVVLTQTDYPDPATANQAQALVARAGLKFGTDPNLDLQPFSWQLDITGSAHDGQQTGLADATGQFSVQVTPTGQATLTILVTECLFSPAVPYLDVCAQQTIIRVFGRVITGSVTVLTETGLQQISDVGKIDGSLTIQSSAVTSSDLHELALLHEVTGRFSVVDVPSITTLAGLGLAKVGTLALNRLPNLTSLTSAARIAYDGLDVSQMNGLTSLNGLQTPPATVAAGLRIASNPALTDLSLLHGVTAVTGVLDVRGNGALANLNDLNGVTQVGSDAIVGGIGLSGTPLAALATVGGSLTIEANDLDGLTQLSLPALTSIGGSLSIAQIRLAGGAPPATALAIALPALLTIGQSATGGGSAPVRTVDLSLPALQSMGAGSSASFSQLVGVRTLAIGPVRTTNGGALEVFNDPDLETLTIGGVQIDENIEIDDNPALVTLQFTAGIQVGGNIEIDDNNALVSIQFAGVIQVGSNVEIDDNDALASIQFAGGTIHDNLEIDFNPALTTLTGPLSLVGGNLEVDFNASLSNQAATAWAAAITVGGLTQINNNKSP